MFLTTMTPFSMKFKKNYVFDYNDAIFNEI